MIKHVGPIAGLAGWGEWVATAGYDNQLILWDAKTRVALARGLHDHLVNDCRFSPSGRWLVSASSDYSARLWTVPDMRLQAVLPRHADDVDMAVFSPDETRIATCALDRKVRIFDLNGQCLQEMSGHTGNVLSISWSTDNNFVISSSVDGSIRRWDVKTGSLIQTTNLTVRCDSVEVDDSEILFAGDDLGRIAIINGEQISFIQAHQAGIKKLVIDREVGFLATLSYDRSMAIWAFDGHDRLKEISRTLIPECVWARAACILPSGQVACGTFGSTYALYDPVCGIWDVKEFVPGQSINAVLKDGSVLYSIGDSGVLHINGVAGQNMGSLCNFLVQTKLLLLTGGQMGQLFNAQTGEVLFEHHSPLNCAVSFERNQVECLAVGTYTGEIELFEVTEKNTLKHIYTLKAFINAVKGLSFSEGVLFSVCASTEIVWFNTTDWSRIKTREQAHDRIANACCAIGANGFASVGRDLTLRIWEGDDSSIYVTPHKNSIKCMAIDDEKSFILTGSYGGTVSLFDLKNKAWLKTSRPTTSGISSIIWDVEKKCFLAGSYDGHIYDIK